MSVMSNSPKTSGRADLTESLMAGRNPALLTASLITNEPRSTVLTPLRAHPKLPTAVLAPLTITTSLILKNLLMLKYLEFYFLLNGRLFLADTYETLGMSMDSTNSIARGTL